MATLSYLNLDCCCIGKAHPVWGLACSSPHNTRMSMVQVKLLTQRYPLFGNRTAGAHYGRPCPLCKLTEESTVHFLLECPVLAGDRQPFIENITVILGDSFTDLHINEKAKLLLNGVISISSQGLQAEVSTVTRNLCYTLHIRRSKLMKPKN